MNIQHPGFEILPMDEEHGGLALIAMAGHTCYKSELREDETSFVRSLMKRGHDSVLEHGGMIFSTDMMTWQIIRGRIQSAPGLVLTEDGKNGYVGANIRALRQLFRDNPPAGYCLAAHCPELWLEGLPLLSEWQPLAMKPFAQHFRRVTSAELEDARVRRLLQRVSVRFTIDRGVSHEFVRHREFSFSQESTRYCDYSGNGITVIEPSYLEPGSEAHGLWWRAMTNADVTYRAMIKQGCTPQEARAVLPTSTKTELVMTGNLAAWQHFFDLRAKQVTGKAHPQAVEVAQPLYEVFRGIYPGIIE